MTCEPSLVHSLLHRLTVVSRLETTTTDQSEGNSKSTPNALSEHIRKRRLFLELEPEDREEALGRGAKPNPGAAAGTRRLSSRATKFWSATGF